MQRRLCEVSATKLMLLALLFACPAMAAEKPNILFIMGDDIGIMNVGAYHRGLMVGETPISTASPRKARSS
jgi:arylsulfatase